MKIVTMVAAILLNEMASLFVCPIAGAYIASKILRKSSEPRRFSVGLAPDRDGNLSAVATLRF